MSRTTQEKFLEALEVLAATYEFEVIDDHGYSNTGTIRLESRSRFGAVLSFKYSFQQGYSSFDDVTPPFERKTTFVLPHEIQSRVLDPIAEVLKKA